MQIYTHQLGLMLGQSRFILHGGFSPWHPGLLMCRLLILRLTCSHCNDGIVLVSIS